MDTTKNLSEIFETLIINSYFRSVNKLKQIFDDCPTGLKVMSKPSGDGEKYTYVLPGKVGTYEGWGYTVVSDYVEAPEDVEDSKPLDSTGYSVKIASKMIATLSLDEIPHFVTSSEERKGVLKAVEQRLAELIEE